ncbi:hypothetical protein Back11_11400 [Paenibacillus baekrokdamisoli]|uniref:Uncharacterized protein n=1 Tax=Paenibacillus baekrokdamisoli TaxID=1712516 RepID=A0A3G9IUR2_9BACL|nr:putative Fe-S cluster-containing protein [Paenibacillus baekrokdamisoli]BBH19795.1 hypothetical protein Back11_11400 [Paenibacillus baekrokdamisoli]
MLKGTFPIELDGQQAQMIVNALRDKANHCSCTEAAMYHILAQQVLEGKQAFHNRTYTLMAQRYDLLLPSNSISSHT